MCKVASLFMIFERIPTVVRFPLTSFSHLIKIENNNNFVNIIKHYQKSAHTLGKQQQNVWHDKQV